MQSRAKQQHITHHPGVRMTRRSRHKLNRATPQSHWQGKVEREMGLFLTEAKQMLCFSVLRTSCWQGKEMRKKDSGEKKESN
jgi:hypothetical protein